MEKDLNDIIAEIESVSLIIESLAYPLDGDCTKLRPVALQTALYGVSRYLERIAEDLGEMEEERERKDQSILYGR